MSKEIIGFTEIAEPGEPYFVSAARVSIWILTQLNPEQFRQFALEKWGEVLPSDYVVKQSAEWASRAAIPLIDHNLGLLLGLRLDHPNINGVRECVEWRSKGVKFGVGISDDDKIDIELRKVPPTFTIHTPKLNFFVTNVFQEAEWATTGEVELVRSGDVSIPVPKLVESIPSVFVWISPDRQRFMQATYRPPNINTRDTIEEILTEAKF